MGRGDAAERIHQAVGTREIRNTEGPEKHSGPFLLPTGKTIKQVLEEHARDLMSVPGVVGIAEGLCDGEAGIRVMVLRRTPELERRIPDRLEGYRVSIRVTGELDARDEA